MLLTENNLDADIVPSCLFSLHTYFRAGVKKMFGTQNFPETYIYWEKFPQNYNMVHYNTGL